MSPTRPPRSLGDDEGGAMLVVEAILVAMLVLTAILFFSSQQRPTLAADTGGIDLGSIASDTLDILETRTFTIDCVTAEHPSAPDNRCENVCQFIPPGSVNTCQLGPIECNAEPPDDCCPSGDTDAQCAERRGALMLLLAVADEAATEEVDGFLSAVVPAGSKYLLRLDNGIDPLPLLPVNPAADPRGARAAKGLFFPADWEINQQHVTATTQYATPGGAALPGTTAHSWMNPAGAINCIQGPMGASVGPDGADADADPDTWLSVWRTGWTGATTPAILPGRLPFGAWFASSDACATVDSVVFVSLASGLRSGQPIAAGSAAYCWTQAAAGGTCPSLPLCIKDPSGSSLAPDGPDAGTAQDPWVTRWGAIPDPDATPPDLTPWKATQNQIPNDAGVGAWTAYSDAGCTTAYAAAPTVTLVASSPFVPYGLEMVVWFGA